MSEGRYKIVQDPLYKYFKLDPVPEAGELSKFYQSKYYELIRKGGRACDLGRLMAGGEEAEQERNWLQKTLYDDIISVINDFVPGGKVLDIGCGSGEFIAYAITKGFDAVGIEPSKEAVEAAKLRGLRAYCCDLEGFVRNYELNTEKIFDVVVMLYVLEHVPDPVNIINLVKEILMTNGVLCVRVPNDFSEIQLTAQKTLNKEAWWIAAPDHINYFNFDSLHFFLREMGFEILYSQGDFPMELFLLMGDDYVENHEIGSRCHKKRRHFEMSLQGDFRRKIYCALANIGIGRDCLVFCRRK
jgi:SAM-dependent methyltransferase